MVYVYEISVWYDIKQPSRAGHIAEGRSVHFMLLLILADKVASF
jgi:hypothetical protein